MPRIIENLTTKVSQWYDSISEKERRLLNILGWSLSGFLLIVIMVASLSKLSGKEEKIVQLSLSSKKISSLEPSFLSAKAKHQEFLRNINENSISLFSVLPAIISKYGLQVSGLDEKTKNIPKTDLVETSVNVNLQKLSVDKLNAILEDIEEYGDDNQIKVTRLKVTNNFEEPDLLDVQMTVATWTSSKRS